MRFSAAEDLDEPNPTADRPRGAGTAITSDAWDGEICDLPRVSFAFESIYSNSPLARHPPGGLRWFGGRRPGTAVMRG
jgi:hypothetical protein